MNKGNIEDTIVAISTPIGEGGIGIVRMSGSNALEIADGIFISPNGGKPSKFKTYTTHYGYIVDTKAQVHRCTRAQESKNTTGKAIDEVILTVMRAPKTYTKEDVVEINCHGGIQALKEVMELVMKHGARMAEPGEFTKRAFLNGRIDLAQAEAVLDMIRAKTESSLKAAVNQLEGGLSDKVNEIRDEVIRITSQIEAAIDFSEEELDIKTAGIDKAADKVLSGLEALISSSREGIILREGILAVICGKPNAGKSSLMNLLLKRDRVIVTPIPGTTRDAVEEMINLRGIPIRLVDTAGIGSTKDPLEKESIKRSKSYLGSADLVLLMLDSSTGLDGEDMDIIKMVSQKRKIIVLNKMDLAKKIDRNKLKGMFNGESIVELSVKKRVNIDLLEKAIADMVWEGRAYQGEGAIVANARHKELLDRAFENMVSVKKGLLEKSSPELVAIDLKEAVFNLGLVVGKSVSNDILNRIFEEFCIGK